MLSTTDIQTLRKTFEQYEGKIPHMYLDTKGLVTVGVGYLLATVVEAQKLPFIVDKTGKKSHTGRNQR